MKDIDGNGYDDTNDFLNMNNEEIVKTNSIKKFDILLSNPPFNLGVKFFQKYFEIAEKIITIQPTKWLLTNKQNKNLTNKIDKQYCEIETVNGNEYFDAGLFADVSINYVDSKKSHKLIFDNKEYNKCSDIKQWSGNDSLETFIEHLGEVNNSLWDNIKSTTHWDKGYESNPNNEWWCIKIPKICGNVNRNKNKKLDLESINSSWLSIFINTVNWDNFINYNDKKNMTLKQLYMSYQYLSFKEDDSFVRSIVSSGMVDTKKNKFDLSFVNDKFNKKVLIPLYKQ